MSTRYTVAVLTISDSASAGLRDDKGGDTLAQLMESAGFTVTHREVIPDERQVIINALTRCCATRDIRCVLTTGGTGISHRDVTPEATQDVLERKLPGISEAMRQTGLKHTPLAMLSRQMAGVSKGTLVINFPGREKAVRECFEVVEPVLKHAVDIICGDTEHDE